MWTQRREEAREALTIFLGSRDAGEMRSKEVAQKCGILQPEQQQKRRESGGRLATHLTSTEELRVSEGKECVDRSLGGETLRRKRKKGKEMVFHFQDYFVLE